MTKIEEWVYVYDRIEPFGATDVARDIRIGLSVVANILRGMRDNGILVQINDVPSVHSRHHQPLYMTRQGYRCLGMWFADTGGKIGISGFSNDAIRNAMLPHKDIMKPEHRKMWFEDTGGGDGE